MRWYQPIESDKTVKKPLVCDYCNFEDLGYVEDDFPNSNVRVEIVGVIKFVLNEKRLENFDIIRLKEYNQRFFVSEKYINLF